MNSNDFLINKLSKIYSGCYIICNDGYIVTTFDKIQNSILISCIVKLDRDFLEMKNIQIEYNKDFYCCIILTEISLEILEKYFLNQDTNGRSFYEIVKLMTINKLFKKKYETFELNNLGNFLNICLENNFWKNNKNKLIKIDEYYDNNNAYYLNDYNFNNINFNSPTEYGEQTNYKSTKRDIYLKLNQKEFDSFFENIVLDINHQDLVQKDTFVIDKFKTYFIESLLNTKDLSTYILKSEHINKLNINRFNGNMVHAFSLSWMLLLLEEINNGPTEYYRFDIRQACKLPLFSDYSNEINENPYLQLPLEKLRKNCFYFCNTHKNQGIVNLDIFKQRAKIFIEGIDNDYNIIDKISFDNISICGSIMACCCPKNNIFFKNRQECLRNDEDIISSKDFENFCTEYYKDSDVDVICDLEGPKFLDRVKKFKEELEDITKKNVNIDTVIKNNIYINKKYCTKIYNKFLTKYSDKIKNFYDLKDCIRLISNQEHIHELFDSFCKDLSEYNKMNESDNSTLNIWLSDKKKEFFNNILCEKVSELININYKIFKPKNIRNKEEITEYYINNIDEIKNKLNSYKEICKDIKNHIYLDYLVEHKKNKENIDPNNEDYKIYYSECNIDECSVFLTDKEEPLSYAMNIKKRLSIEGIKTFELFSVKNIEKTCFNFHLPIVYSYYNGTTVFMTASCISACMTFQNLWYKLNPKCNNFIHIFFKYLKRGFNIKTKNNIFKYLSMKLITDEKYKNDMYLHSIHNKSMRKKSNALVMNIFKGGVINTSIN